MGDRSKIDYIDSSWNVVSGCFHDCPYCYARKIANRYGMRFAPRLGDPGMEGACKYDSEEAGQDTMLELEKPYHNFNGAQPYPMAFHPTFHRYRLDIPARWKKPRTIFVCSMADLFGCWIPDRWIADVFAACTAAPQHRYLFLTKNPKRYIELANKDMLPMEPNMWFGSTTTTTDAESFYALNANTFISIEPIQEHFHAMEEISNPFSALNRTNWIIVGAETGNRKGKIIPQREWITDLRDACAQNHTPLFMKESLRELMGADFVQQFPWEAQ